jgi:ectoine hydroxylase-related dioxygenase (phytanoyl-CoA dioxygenase family)
MAEAMTQSTGSDDRSLDTPYPVADEQIRNLHEKSWTPLPGFLSKEDVSRIRDLLLAIPDRGFLSGPDSPDIDSSQLMLHDGTSFENPEMMEFVMSPRITGAAVDLMKVDEAMFVQDISFFKPVNSLEVPWHQDFSFWPFDRWGNLSIWIALEDIEPEMGVLRYLEGSHREGPLGFIEVDRDIRDVYPQLREMKRAGETAMKAGDARAHWDLTVHGSAVNTGDRRRSALSLRFHRPDAIYNGIDHPHYNRFKMKPGQRFGACPAIPRVGRNGRIAS